MYQNNQQAGWKAEWICLIFLLWFCAVASAENTAFTFQGRLNLNQSGVTGNYDLSFGLFTNSIDGTPVGTVTNYEVIVTDGLFVVSLDYGNLIAGPAYWLEVGVRPSGSGSNFVILAPRQSMTPAPFAMYALYGTITTNVFFGNGAGLTNLAGANIVSGPISPSLIGPSGLGAMAFQPTNGPTMFAATQHGQTQFPDSNNSAGAWFADYAVLSLGNYPTTPYFTLRSNPAHGPGDEIEMVATRRFALVAGEAGYFDDAIQIGYAGIFNENNQGAACPLYFQHDDLGDMSGTNDLGYSMLVYFVTSYLGLQEGPFIGMRAEAVDTNGGGSLVFYNVQNTNPLIGEAPGTKIGVEIWTNGLVTHGRLTSDITQARPGYTYGVDWDAPVRTEVNMTVDITITNIPVTYGRTNQADTRIIYFFSGINSHNISFPTNWSWGSSSPSSSAPTNVPADTILKVEVEMLNDNYLYYLAHATYYPYTPP